VFDSTKSLDKIREHILYTVTKEDSMNERQDYIPRVGVVALAFPGYFLGEEKAQAKYEEMLSQLEKKELEIFSVDAVAMDTAAARTAGDEFDEKGVDVILAVLTTFVPDHFIVELLEGCDVPIYLWAIEREMDCISLVGAMLVNPTLFELHKTYQLSAGEVGDGEIMDRLVKFARSVMMCRILRGMRVGYMGKNPDIMLSLMADEYGLKRTLGVSVVTLRDFEYTRRMSMISEEEALSDWIEIKKMVGQVEVSDEDGIDSSRAYLSMYNLAKEMSLDALSLNCWPFLKSKICLTVSRFNDLGIGAGCEGDLHSTILMRLLYVLSGRAAINGDFMRMYPGDNHIMFSHCGAGSFSFAGSKEEITLHESVETHDGVGVFFPVREAGPVTVLNLIGSRAGYRLSVMVGRAVETEMDYEGNPMRVRFDRPVQDILQSAVACGSGHHWSIAYGDFSLEFEILCQLLGIEYCMLS
jgi:L-fucose isomerase-like protein